jgi:glycosyltransferase involved in cell wall biosynthesis
MASPFFSIVIPTYNRSAIFPLAVRSVLAQTFEDFEVVVSDNCSTDDTAQRAHEFTDPRVRYVQTPQHCVIADSWEFGRRQARGEFILMLSDDDAMVNTALERFAEAAADGVTDFLFSRVATYRDSTFPGPDQNSLDCPDFSGSSGVVAVDEFVRPLFEFRPLFDMHPSAFVFSKALADSAQRRTGRFFWTNGVEFSAWPISAVLARRIVHLDVPLIILGRTGKSWGSNTQLCNPGKERIQAFFEDVDHERKHAPLRNFTSSNLMAEGMLTAKHLFPAEFASFEFDEVQYLRATMEMLSARRAIGVDVAVEMDETLQYAAKYPALAEELRKRYHSEPALTTRVVGHVRTIVADFRSRAVHTRARGYLLARRLRNGDRFGAFWAPGDQFGFSDILGCAEFLSRSVIRTAGPAKRDLKMSAATATMQNTSA